MNKTKYKTALLDCWPMMKELRRDHFKHTWKAGEKGDLVVMGIFEWFLALCAGFGDYANPSYGPYYTGILRDKEKALTCFNTAESKGFKRDICASMRCHLGQLYMGLTEKSPKGDTVKPDFILQPAACYAMSKTGQIVSEELGIPYLNLEFPTKDSGNTRAYLTTEMQEAIEWMEKKTDRKFNDELFINAVQNEWECMVLWARICEMTKTIPSPLDYRQMWSLRIPNITSRHKRETVTLYRILFDEVKERVAKGISATPYETARLFHQFLPPFYALNIFKEPWKYGASFIGGDGAFTSMGAWMIHEDGTWEAAKMPHERGVNISTREAALEALADLYLGYLPASRCTLTVNQKEAAKMIHDWHVDGVVLMIDRGCKTLSAGQEEQIVELKDAGIPTMVYEGSHADFRDYNEIATLNRLDFFLESLGLKELDEFKEGQQ
ncbi:MAG: 2-hydroxyacyl-CoA dehydratase [Deltaproteobacteria bacterium]|nr:2-hydroxyacyl-CoA dehydratase [Deltaproteobacteria bacterium]